MFKVNWLGKALMGLTVANIGVYAINKVLENHIADNRPQLSQHVIEQLALAAQAGDVNNFVAWYHTERPYAGEEELNYAWQLTLDVLARNA